MSKYAGDSTGTQIEGVVSGLRERAETVGKGPGTRVEQVVTFTLVCEDEQPQVVVRATRLEGPLFEGDRVAIGVSARRLPGTAIRTVVLRNLTRGAVFGVTTGRRRSPRALLLAVAAVTLAAVAVALIAVLILGRPDRIPFSSEQRRHGDREHAQRELSQSHLAWCERTVRQHGRT